MTAVAIAIAAGFLLLIVGVPVAFAFGLITVILALAAWPGLLGLNILAINTYSVVTNETLIALPLFIFMAEIVMGSGLGTRVFDGVQRLLWRVPGGLAATSMASCIGFASITGSSAANTATVGRVAVQEMIDRKYDKRLAVGSIAAGGALGILIPPSTFMVVYGVLTNTSVAMLFVAGILPGLMLGAMFLGYIILRAMITPELAPRISLASSIGEYARAAASVVPLLLLAGALLGAIYAGIATPNEIAAIGVAGAILLSVILSGFDATGLWLAAKRAVVVSCMIFWIMIGTWSFGYILNYLGVGGMLASLIQDYSVSPLAVILAINLLLFVLGMFLDPGAILMLVMPLALPVLRAAEIDLIWFGIIFTINMELGMITPPFGMNLFIMKGIAPRSVRMNDIVMGAVPFMILELVAIAILIIWPEIALWMPQQLMGR
jgi:C4-dicarboxylate transporter, DctM subunit